MTDFNPQNNQNSENGAQQTADFVCAQKFFNLITLQKRQIRGDSNKAALAYLVVMAIGSLWFTVLYSILQPFGVTENGLLTFAREPAIMQFIQTVMSVLMFTVPFIVLFHQYPRDSVKLGFNRTKQGTVLPLILMGIGFCAFANLATAICGNFFYSLGFSDDYPVSDYPIGFWGFLISVISTAVIPALVEEFAFRGVLFGILRRYGTTFAVVTSSVIFALMHGNYQQIFFAFMVGLTLGYIRVRSDSIYICMLIHFINNFNSICIDYIGKSVDANIVNAVYNLYLVVALGIAIVGLLLFAKRDETALKMSNDGYSGIPQKRVYLWFFTSPAMIIALIATAIKTVFM